MQYKDSIENNALTFINFMLSGSCELTTCKNINLVFWLLPYALSCLEQ